VSLFDAVEPVTHNKASVLKLDSPLPVKPFLKHIYCNYHM
jgi:hypothetical protein